jgi:hypothetical protein
VPPSSGPSWIVWAAVGGIVLAVTILVLLIVFGGAS